MLHRHADLVSIACRSNLTNSFCSGCLQTSGHQLYKTPTYHAQQLYATLAGDRPLRPLKHRSPPRRAPDLSATLAPQGDAVVLFAVNPGLEAISRPLDFSAFGVKGQELEAWTLADTRNAGEPDAANSFDAPERVVPRRSTVVAASPRFTYRFPPLSLSVLPMAAWYDRRRLQGCRRTPRIGPENHRMPTVHVEAEISRDELFKAVEQLSPPDFSQFLSQVLSLRARREAPSLSVAESQLLLRINQGIPDELGRRYGELIAKRQAETLTQEELEELLRLTDVVEGLEAEPDGRLAALARSRSVSLGALMADLGIPEPSHD